MPAPSEIPIPPLKDWIQRIGFLTSAAKVSDLPAPAVAEIAIAGRSNAGKSSALNFICNRRRLAFSSKTPGRTQLINLFSLMHREEEFGRLVDLPGYGYAAVSHDIKTRWQRELAQFLASRQSLVGLMLVMDIRHPFGPLDLQMLDWFHHRGQPIHVLLTKADKLTRSEQAKALSAAHSVIGKHAQTWGGQTTASLFSATARVGREQALEKIAQWWGLPAEGEPSGPEAKKNPAKESPGGNA